MKKRERKKRKKEIIVRVMDCDGGGIEISFFCSLLFLSVVVALPVSLSFFISSYTVGLLFAVHFSIFPRLPKVLFLKIAER